MKSTQRTFSVCSVCSVYTLALSLAFAWTLSPSPASADSGFRCESGKLVNVGDRAYDVRKKCGDPDAVTTRVVKRKVKHKVRRWIGNVMQEVSEEHEVEIPVDEWTYDMGPQKFIRIVAFENDRVTEVATGSYGHASR